MLIWLNGAHGAGKTSVARRIAALRPAARLIDPEQIGFMLRRTWPGQVPDDFKDLPVLRRMTLTLLKEAAADADGALLIVPMTLTQSSHHEEIVGGLRSAGLAIRHFTLVASAETLRRRLRWRLDWPASRRWALERAEATAAALDAERFAEHIRSDDLSVSEVADAVLARAAV
jgi:predicted kinase